MVGTDEQSHTHPDFPARALRLAAARDVSGPALPPAMVVNRMKGLGLNHSAWVCLYKRASTQLRAKRAGRQTLGEASCGIP